MKLPYGFFVLIIMAGWWSELLDVKGALLTGRFDKGEELYMEVPQVMEKYYLVNVLLLLLRILYGLRQTAAQFWKELLKAFMFMKYARNQADPCLYFRWVKGELVICISWVGDFLLTGPNKMTQLEKSEMMIIFECE